MMRRLTDKKTGHVVAIEADSAGMAKLLSVPEERLSEWSKLLKPHHQEDDGPRWWIKSKDELLALKQRAAVLNTNMTEAAVKQIEKTGLLPAYAALAEDCPQGVTAHLWRSYGVVVLLQARYGKMIGAKELAERASLVDKDGKPDEKTAEKHLRLLQALDLLQEGDGRWEHRGLPKSWRGN